MSNFWSGSWISHPRWVILISILSTLGVHAQCNDVVMGLRTSHLKSISLCDLQSRYAAAIVKLKAQGIANPLHIGNIYATRFIKRTDWERYLAAHGDSPFAAWRVYDPSPTSWANWARSAEFVDTSGDVFLTRSNQELRDRLLRLHKSEMDGLLDPSQVGVFRSTVEEIIPLHSVRDAYTAGEIRALAGTPFVSKLTGHKLMSFVARGCDDFPAQKPGNLYFKLKAVTEEPWRECGDLTMAPAAEVAAQMDAWISRARTLDAPGKIDVSRVRGGVATLADYDSSIHRRKRPHEPLAHGRRSQQIWITNPGSGRYGR